MSDKRPDPQAPQLHNRITYRIDVLARRAAHTLLADYRRLLTRAVEAPDTWVWRPSRPLR
ncbi:MAG TPA: hypothetical protein VFA45_18935 [Actinomycetes bacterium]|nr:hypothetical protein [Actinomycetes bacterium]